MNYTERKVKEIACLSGLLSFKTTIIRRFRKGFKKLIVGEHFCLKAWSERSSDRVTVS